MRQALAAAGLLAASLALTFALDPWQHELVSDIPLYRGYADLFLDGTLPYRDVDFEYPPLAAPLLASPGLVSLDLETYRLVFAGFTLLLAVVLAIATALAAEQGGGSRWTALVAVALAPLVTGAMIRTHFDLAPVLCLVAGLAAIAARRSGAGFALLGVGGALKLFPLLAVPVAAAWLLAHGRRAEAVRGLVIALGVAAAALAAAVAVSPEGTWQAVEYHLERPIQIESLPATVLNAVDAFGGTSPEPVHSHRSDGLSHPAATALEAAFLGLLCAALAALALVAVRIKDVRGLALAGLGAAAALAVFGKVLSPQFMIWLVPLAALAWAWQMRALAAAAVASVAVTLAWFPERYFDLVDREVGPLVAVAARNVLLLLTMVLLARELRALVRASPAAARSTRPARPRGLRSAPR